jgi:hypothetical protein
MCWHDVISLGTYGMFRVTFLATDTASPMGEYFYIAHETFFDFETPEELVLRERWLLHRCGRKPDVPFRDHLRTE